jgi:TRAP-type C4-dicarboxylate transport system permease small subunit
MTDTTKEWIGRISSIAAFLLIIIPVAVKSVYEPDPEWTKFKADYLILALLFIGIAFSIWASFSVWAKEDK